ncbi:MAG: protein-disulfide reductase DsbD domain-containing protein [Dehalococcoidia bacterium]
MVTKRFYASYRERDTGSGLLNHVLGIATPPAGPERIAIGEGVTVRARFDRETYAWGQRLWLTVELTPAAGIHLNGPAVPEGYQPLAIALRLPERVVAGEPAWPATRDLAVASIGEVLPVYDGPIRVEVPVSFMVVDAGPLEIGVDITYQACTESDCLLPATVRLELPVEESALIERPRPAAG